MGFEAEKNNYFYAIISSLTVKKMGATILENTQCH